MIPFLDLHGVNERFRAEMDAATARVHIPMQGNIESLNAAMAAGILLFEGARQRRI